MSLLAGKVAVVTGAGRGIGREHALLMAKLGAKVVVNDLGAHFDGTGAPTATPAQDVVAEIKKNGGDAIANGDNVADFKAAKNIVDTAIKTFGKLNIVVNNAGILRDRMIFNMDEESWDAVVAVHLKGTFAMSPTPASTGARSTRRERAERPASSTRRRTRPPRQRRADELRSLQGCGRDHGDHHHDEEVRRDANAIAPVARTRSRSTRRVDRRAHGRRGQAGEFDVGARRTSPLVAWLASDDAAGCNGQVFRVGGRTVCR